VPVRVVEADWKATSVPAPIRHRKFTSQGFIIVLSWLDDEDRKSQWGAVVASVVRGPCWGMAVRPHRDGVLIFAGTFGTDVSRPNRTCFSSAASGAGKVPSESISSPQFGLPVVS